MKTGLIFVLALMLTAVSLVQADDDPETPWPIEERCLPAPTQPPEGWTFEGELLVDGWAGIHGVNAELEAPYVVHWGDGWLSPNGDWILEWNYDYYVERNDGGGPLGFYNYNYHNIEVTNLNSRERLVFSWSASLSISSGPYPHPSAGPLWLNNHSFVSFYGWSGGAHQVGSLETGEITEWTGVGLEDYEASISPDQTRVISYSRLFDLVDNSLITENVLGTNYDRVRAVWSPDSMYFADLITDSDDTTNRLSIFDRDGNLVAQPMAQGHNRLLPESWSPDTSQLAFTVVPNPMTRRFSPYILDLQREVIYDLCVDDVRGWAWSPDGSSFATLLGEGQQPLIVVNMDEWQAYIVAYHTGYVLKWRSVGS